MPDQIIAQTTDEELDAQTGVSTDSLTAPTNEQRAEDEERRRVFIAALRQCATFFEDHPNVRMPRYNIFNVFVDSRDDLARIAKGVSWEKVFNENWFYLRHVFCDDLTLEINANRETVCRKVVVGKKVLPAQPAREVDEFVWECDNEPLLAEGR